MRDQPVSDPSITAVAELLDAEVVEIDRERKGKTTVDDVRPYLRSLTVVGPGARGLQIEAELGTQPRGLRPDSASGEASP